jgi:hypothetical protein
MNLDWKNEGNDFPQSYIKQGSHNRADDRANPSNIAYKQSVEGPRNMKRMRKVKTDVKKGKAPTGQTSKKGAQG